MKSLIWMLVIAAAGAGVWLLAVGPSPLKQPGERRTAERAAPQPPRLAQPARPPRAAFPAAEALPAPQPSTPTGATARAAAEVVANVSDAIADERLLSFYDEADAGAFERLARSRGFEVLARTKLGHTLRLGFRSQAELEALLRDGPRSVEDVPNVRMRVPPPPADGGEPRGPEGTYVGFGDTALSWLGLPSGLAAQGNGVTVAVIDSGVGELGAAALARLTRIQLAGAAAGADPTGHGSSVANLIAGGGKDGTQGVAPGVGVLSIGVTAPDGTADLFTVAQAIVEAVDRGAAVINLSLGTAATHPLLVRAVDYAVAAGAVIVASAGNDGTAQLHYPAAYDSVIAVGAVDASGRQLYFSNRGEALDLAAPGLGVATVNAAGQRALFSGTSAAAPFVSGAIALLMNAYPGLTAREAADVLMATADDRGVPGPDPEYGRGVLNLGRALQHSTPGILDIAVGDPQVGADGRSVTLWVQNRGTEPLAAADLEMDVDGVLSSTRFYNLAPGQTSAREFALPTPNLARYGEIRLRVSARIVGAEDTVPRNNTIGGSFRARP
jgi:hypothetical protein